jgi:hypothetical protein
LSSGRTPAKTANCSGWTASGIGPGGQIAPSSPTAFATMAAVAGASPVTITVRTPSPCNSLMSAAESGRGGSLSAMSPASFMAVAVPAATASTLKPFASSSFAAAIAVGDGCARPMTMAEAPFTIRCGRPVESVAVASDIFSEMAFLAAAARMVPSTGSWPPFGTRQRGQRQNVRLVEAGHRRTVVTVNALRVSVPVLSAHKTLIDAASSTAERRVGRTPCFAKARAPSAAARVKVAGSATGIDASTAVRTRGMTSSSGSLRIHA